MKNVEKINKFEFPIYGNYSSKVVSIIKERGLEQISIGPNLGSPCCLRSRFNNLVLEVDSLC